MRFNPPIDVCGKCNQSHGCAAQPRPYKEGAGQDAEACLPDSLTFCHHPQHKMNNFYTSQPSIDMNQQPLYVEERDPNWAWFDELLGTTGWANVSFSPKKPVLLVNHARFIAAG